MSTHTVKLLNPRNQLSLFEYKKNFNNFINLFKKNKMHHSILFNGPKGSGKATFAYHLANCLLSKNEVNKYSLENNVIFDENISYKQICSGLHPNFFALECEDLEKDIKIEKVRKLLKFLNTTTYSKNLKIILLDNAENLNLNSSNALLKSIEEPPKNTFFFIIHNSSYKILSTIKSRSIEYKFFLSLNDKKNCLSKIISQYKLVYDTDKLVDNFYFDTPGNLVNYIILLSEFELDPLKSISESIYFFIEKYKKEKNPEILQFLSTFVEKFYKDMAEISGKNAHFLFLNKSKIIRQISDLKKFNLSEKNLFLYIKDVIANDAK